MCTLWAGFISPLMSVLWRIEKKLKKYVFEAKLSPKGSIDFLILNGLEGILRNSRH